MKKLIVATAVGAACLVGCQTAMGVAGHSSGMEDPQSIAQNPDFAQGEGGFLLEGTVVADYVDALVIQDENGLTRSVRIQRDTVFRPEDGGATARQFLEPGSQVRASYDFNDKERIAQEVIIVNDLGEGQPNAWPERPSPYHRDP
jgi:hypothetical protein